MSDNQPPNRQGLKPLTPEELEQFRQDIQNQTQNQDQIEVEYFKINGELSEKDVRNFILHINKVTGDLSRQIDSVSLTSKANYGALEHYLTKVDQRISSLKVNSGNYPDIDQRIGTVENAVSDYLISWADERKTTENQLATSTTQIENLRAEIRQMNGQILNLSQQIQDSIRSNQDNTTELNRVRVSINKETDSTNRRLAHLSSDLDSLKSNFQAELKSLETKIARDSKSKGTLGAGHVKTIENLEKELRDLKNFKVEELGVPLSSVKEKLSAQNPKVDEALKTARMSMKIAEDNAQTALKQQEVVSDLSSRAEETLAESLAQLKTLNETKTLLVQWESKWNGIERKELLLGLENLAKFQESITEITSLRTAISLDQQELKNKLNQTEDKLSSLMRQRELNPTRPKNKNEALQENKEEGKFIPHKAQISFILFERGYYRTTFKELLDIEGNITEKFKNIIPSQPRCGLSCPDGDHAIMKIHLPGRKWGLYSLQQLIDQKGKMFLIEPVQTYETQNERQAGDDMQLEDAHGNYELGQDSLNHNRGQPFRGRRNNGPKPPKKKLGKPGSPSAKKGLVDAAMALLQAIQKM